MANITVVGNTAGPVELRFTAGGKAVANFSLAENHGRRNQQTREWEQTGTTWRRVSLWEEKAEALAELNPPKGSKVVVVGREELKSWERDGKSGQTLELVADWVGIVPQQPRQDGGRSQGGGRQSAPQADPWSGDNGQNYDWGAGNDQNPPF